MTCARQKKARRPLASFYCKAELKMRCNRTRCRYLTTVVASLSGHPQGTSKWFVISQHNLQQKHYFKKKNARLEKSLLVHNRSSSSILDCIFLRPKGGRGRLIEVAVQLSFNFPFFSITISGLSLVNPNSGNNLFFFFALTLLDAYLVWLYTEFFQGSRLILPKQLESGRRMG